MNERLLKAWVWARCATTGLIKDESGEGVISSAIAVLIVAALGALMWVGFRAIWDNASTHTSQQIDKIGQ